MNSGGFGNIRLIPHAASTFAGSVDAISFALLAASVVVLAVVFSLMLYFAVKYHYTSTADRTPDRVEKHHNGIEVAWTAIPFLIFIFLFVWAARVFFRMHSPPPGALEIHVIGKQWMWKFQHADGTRELADLHVPEGRPVRLIMSSEDVIHSFFVPAFRIKQDVLPDRYTSIWFEANQTGTYRIFCTQYCGTSHARMTGFIHVLSPEQYEEWLSTQLATLKAAGPLPQGASGPQAGARLFEKLACDHCHTDHYGVRVGPPLEGVYGHEVRLRTGEVVFADENYLRESILSPSVKIVEGYEDLMPTYRGRVNEDELLDLIAYIKSLKGAQQKGSEPPSRHASATTATTGGTNR